MICYMRKYLETINALQRDILLHVMKEDDTL